MPATDHLPTGLRHHTPPQPLILSSGQALPRATIGFQTWGRLNSRRDNVVWVCHALTASSDVPGWWPALWGPGRLLDPERHFIVCANVLGGCYGSIGPGSDRGDGRCWGGDFPEIEVADLVAHQRLLFEHLGLNGIELVLGGSMGGFQALEWALQEPHRVKRLALVASSWRQPADAVALGELQCAFIRQDPEFRDGHYAATAGPRQGLALARQLGHFSYRSQQEFEQRFGRQARADGRLQVLSYLDHQGDKLVRRFDANSYLRLTAAMNRFDLGRSEPAVAVLGRIRADARVIAVDGDRLYPPREQEALARLLPRAELIRVSSERGHDGFLADAAAFEPALRQWLHGPVEPRNCVNLPAAASAARAEAEAAVPIAVFGATGRVGSALLSLLPQAPRRWRLVAASNSRGSVWQGDGLDADAIADLLRARAAPWPPAVVSARLPAGTLIVDATASAEVAEAYPAWLAQGHAIVAANKLAFAGPQWSTLSGQQQRLGASAVVGAGLPILSTLRRIRDSGDRLTAFEGVLSGTLGLLLDRLHEGVDLESAVAEAVQLGLAEPDPAADLGGLDVLRKLVIILRHAGLPCDPAQVALTPLLPPRADAQGINAWLREHGRAWSERVRKARAVGQRWVYRAQFDGQRALVGPALLPLEHELALARGLGNRAVLHTALHGATPLVIAGSGAGPQVTAAALLADASALASNRSTGADARSLRAVA